MFGAGRTKPIPPRQKRRHCYGYFDAGHAVCYNDDSDVQYGGVLRILCHSGCCCPFKSRCLPFLFPSVNSLAFSGIGNYKKLLQFFTKCAILRPELLKTAMIGRSKRTPFLPREETRLLEGFRRKFRPNAPVSRWEELKYSHPSGPR